LLDALYAERGVVFANVTKRWPFALQSASATIYRGNDCSDTDCVNREMK